VPITRGWAAMTAIAVNCKARLAREEGEADASGETLSRARGRDRLLPASSADRAALDATGSDS
jgi:hypothetical protein